MTFPMLNDTTLADAREDAIQMRAEKVNSEIWRGLDDQLMGQAIGRALEPLVTEMAQAIRETCDESGVDNRRLRRLMKDAVWDEAWHYAEAEMGGPY